PQPTPPFLGQRLIDIQEMRHHPDPDSGCFDLAQLEGEGGGDVGLLDRRLAQIELTRLAIMVCEGLRSDTLFLSLLFDWRGREPGLGRLTGAASRPAPCTRFLLDW